MASNVVAHGKWKKVKIDPNMFVDDEMKNLICIEELTDYEIVDANKSKKNKVNVTINDKTSKKKNKKRIKESEDRQLAAGDSELHEDSVESKLRTKLSPVETATVDVGSNKINKRKKNKKKQELKTVQPTTTTTVTVGDKLNKKRKFVEENERCNTQQRRHSVDLSGWRNLFVPTVVLRCLEELNFTSPTAIQALCLPPAIRDRLDIVAAAETGSGKTLAFAIPLIEHILRDKQQLKEHALEHLEQHKEQDNEVTTDTNSAEDSDYEEDRSEEEESSEEEEMEEENADSSGEDTGSEMETETAMSSSPLYSLVLTPTRELAVQIKDHIEAITKYTDITCCVVVGGMSVQKQTRLLRRCPDIVIATPGRLWQLIEQNNEHLMKLKCVRYLVIDEADRMVEKGHFDELTNILQLVNAETEKPSNWQHQRQTFVFSATLTFVPTKPQRLEFAKKKKKKNIHQITTKEKIESLMFQVGVSENAKLIDLTTQQRTTQTLTEARISCTVTDKDVYLYYVLRQFPGRTLVFANSKDCVRRLVSIFKLLHCVPLALHADMQQRQRLKNLDKFKANPHSLLIATDVAARGLDIPDVQHVVHYQVPRTTESYVHRSGRTARAAKEGLSIMFVSPDDLPNYRKIIKALNRDDDMAIFPVDIHCLNNLKQCVSLAQSVDRDEHRCKKAKSRDRWFRQAAVDMDIELDEDQFSDVESDSQQNAAALQHRLSRQKQQLDALIKQPIISRSYSGKYPTKSGKLQTPFVIGALDGGAAIQQMKQVELKQRKKQQQQQQKKKSKQLT